MAGAIIKAGTGGHRVRADLGGRLEPVQVTPSDPATAERTALQREVDHLSTQLELRDRELETLRQALPEAIREAQDQGRVAGLAAADGREADHLARLEAGIEAALANLSLELKSLEGLSALLALEALRKICGDDANRAALITRIVAVQLAKLRADEEVSILVSSEDFADAAALKGLSPKADGTRVRVQATDQLSSGDCRMQMKLGALDVGPNQQWDALQDLLREFANGADAP